MVSNTGVSQPMQRHTGEGLMISAPTILDPVGSGVIIDRGFFVQGGYFIMPKKLS